MSRAFSAQGVAGRIARHPHGGAWPFPRDMEEAALGFPVEVVDIGGLTSAGVAGWLCRALGWPPEVRADRRLRGCLVAHRGQGLIFLDAEEDADGCRFALAHELAHFVGHYLAGRELAAARLGARVLEALDGDRAPSPAERLSGVLAGCPLGVFHDALERDGGTPLTALAERMECEADAAAFAVLAPTLSVLAKCVATGSEPDRANIVRTLCGEFGLAAADALRHAPAVLATVRAGAPTLVDNLRSAAGRPMPTVHIGS